MNRTHWSVVGVLVVVALVSRGPAATEDRPTTDGVIALANLDAQIDGLAAVAAATSAPVEVTARLIELLETRGRFRGRISDYEWAHALAEAAVRRFPENPVSHLARARTLALLHRFAEARQALEQARARQAEVSESARLEASLDQAVGAFAPALAYRQRAQAQLSAVELGMRAALHGERGEHQRAARDFAAARRQWQRSRDVSPLVPAWLAFEEGLLAMRSGDLPRAHDLLREATRRLPGYVPAQGHLAEVEAEMGQVDAAIERLRTIVAVSDDPDYLHQLGRLLAVAGADEESSRWRALAARRFDEVCERYPLAFADHAAEFWLGIGGDPVKALALARLNAAERRTSRAQELLARALAAQPTSSRGS